MLHAQTLGHGADLVMVHGWGMHGGILQDFATSLARRYRVTVIDLPGHGRSGLIGDLRVEGMAAAILEQAPPAAHWLGWSLGGLLSLQAAALSPTAASSVILMAGTPRFVGDNDWPGMDAGLLRRFANDLDADAHQALRRFLGLQLYGTEDARRLMQTLQARLDTRDAPDVSALRAGLRILATADLRKALAGLCVPVLAMFGRCDRVVSPHTGTALQRLNPCVDVRVVDGAAHLPFWTHADAARSLIEAFLQ